MSRSGLMIPSERWLMRILRSGVESPLLSLKIMSNLRRVTTGLIPAPEKDGLSVADVPSIDFGAIFLRREGSCVKVARMSSLMLVFWLRTK